MVQDKKGRETMDIEVFLWVNAVTGCIGMMIRLKKWSDAIRLDVSDVVAGIISSLYLAWGIYLLVTFGG